MRALLAFCTLLVVSMQAGLPAHADGPARAAIHHADAPKPLGAYGQWLAASHSEGGVMSCFVFTRAEASSRHIPGRGEVVLSVTRRPSRHDVVALAAGFPLSGHEDAPLQAGATRMLFYIAGRSAFAHDNAAAIASFGQESSVTAHLTGPRGVVAVDRFSLKGFAGAYAALAKACPVS